MNRAERLGKALQEISELFVCKITTSDCDHDFCYCHPKKKYHCQGCGRDITIYGYVFKGKWFGEDKPTWDAHEKCCPVHIAGEALDEYP